MARSLSKNLGRDLNVDSPEVDGVLRDMHAILKNIQNESSSNIDKLWQQNWFRRRIAALDTSFTPLRLDDMTARQDEIIQGLMDLGHDEKTAWAAWEAVPKMRNAEFQDLGLYALEAWLRSENQAAQFLKFATGGQGKGLISGRAAYTAAGGYIGYEAGGNFGPEGEDANFGAQIAGAAAGALAGYGAARLGTKAVNKEFGRSARSIMRRTELNRHGYLADELVRIRDAMRFTLSPFFDISRYTEGLMLAQTAAPQRGLNGERLALHLNMAPRALRKRFIKTLGKGVSNTEAQRKAHAWFDEERELFRHAARGDFDPDVLDSTGKWFSQIGIMGFNPTDWMTAAFIELRQVGGLDSETAYKAVREMYTYGTKGRSAAELSTNFVFFPFSFQKKALTHLTKWTQSDLGRSILLHDAMKTYDILDAKYDLNTYWEEHIPMLKQLQKLNLFAYGISPGRFGGINRPFLDPLAKAGTAYAQALFTPTGASIKDAAAAAELQDVMRSLTPALNDINWMVEESKQQFNVFTSQSHVTIDAEISKGYEEWTQIRDDYSRLLEQHGYTWGDLKNKPYLAPQHAQYEAARAQLAQKYPAWFDSRTRSTQNRVALEMEKNDRLSRAETGEGVTRSDIHLAEMENLLNTLRSEGELRNMRFGGNDGWEDAPPAVFEVVQREAQRRVRQDPKFKGIWNKFYARDFGPLEAQL